LRERVESELEAVNLAMSTYIPGSEISRFNRIDPGDFFSISDRFEQVMQAAVRVHEDTGGAFEPTLGPLVDLWGFGSKGRRTGPPAPDAVAEALSRVGLQHIVVGREGLRKAVSGVELDLSAIAKGYGVDRVLDLLMQEGLENVYVEIGGEVACRGVNAQGVPWILGIQFPDALSGAHAYRRLRLKDRALATSGDYRNFYQTGEGRSHHILDPRTGQPASHGLASVSVLAKDCMTADAVATALYVMGAEEGMSWLQAHPDLEALFIVRTPQGFVVERTEGFAVALLPEPAQD
jgi:thiamine biosynthesis lipoprotein